MRGPVRKETSRYSRGKRRDCQSCHEPRVPLAWEHGGAAGKHNLLEEGLAQVQVRLHDAPHETLVHAWQVTVNEEAMGACKSVKHEHKWKAKAVRACA